MCWYQNMVSPPNHLVQLFDNSAQRERNRPFRPTRIEKIRWES